MSRIILAAMAVVLCGASVGFAQGYEYGSYGATYNMYSTPSPSGLRFGGADTMIHPQTLNVAGKNGGCGCGSGCDGGICLDWKLNTWYGSWDGHNHGYGYGGGCSTCGN